MFIIFEINPIIILPKYSNSDADIDTEKRKLFFNIHIKLDKNNRAKIVKLNKYDGHSVFLIQIID